jgi:hypothetical protein
MHTTLHEEEEKRKGTTFCCDAPVAMNNTEAIWPHCYEAINMEEFGSTPGSRRASAAPREPRAENMRARLS